MTDNLGEIASQFVIDAQVILGKEYDRPDVSETVRWCSWHIDSEARCDAENPMASWYEMQARHKAQDYIDLIHYIADIVQCPHPRYKNKVKAHFDERNQRQLERMEIFCRQARERE